MGAIRKRTLVIFSLLLLDSAAFLPQEIIPGDIRLVQLDKFAGIKIDKGIRIVSCQEENQFVIDLLGNKIATIGKERLIWNVDGRQVELSIAEVSVGLSRSLTAEQLLALYGKWDQEQQMSAGHKVESYGEPTKLSEDIDAITLYYQDMTAGIRNCKLAILHGRYAIALAVSSSNQSDDLQAIAYARSVLSSINYSIPKELCSQATATTPEDFPWAAIESGGTLEDWIEVCEALLGEPWAAIINSDLVLPRDKQFSRGVILKPTALLEIAEFYFCTDYAPWPINTCVFDGRNVHAINILGYESATDRFVYFDPWETSSFLQKANNEAGVNAFSHPTISREWVIQAQQIERVTYAMAFSLNGLLELFRTFALINSELAEARAGFVEMEQDSLASAFYKLQGAPFLSRLERIASFLEAKRDNKQANQLRTVIRSLMNIQTEPITVNRDNVKGQKLQLKDAIENDFFKFFNLRKQGEERDNNNRAVVIFRPASTRFRELVLVKVALDEKDSIISNELVIDHSFVFDRVLAPYARDFVGSFIGFLAEQLDLEGLNKLEEEIRRPRYENVPIPGAASSDAVVPYIGSAGCLTYEGLRSSFRKASSKEIFEMQNSDERGVLKIVGGEIR